MSAAFTDKDKASPQKNRYIFFISIHYSVGGNGGVGTLKEPDTVYVPAMV